MASGGRRFGLWALAAAAGALGGIIVGTILWLALEDTPAEPEIAAAPQVIPLPPPPPAAVATPPAEEEPAPPAAPQTAEPPTPRALNQKPPPPQQAPSATPPSTGQTAPPVASAPPANAGAPPRHGPDPALLESSQQGALPRVAPDGRAAWRVYARPFNRDDKRPRIAVVITNLGMSDAATEAAIQRLPGAMTLAFSPYAGPKLPQWLELARVAGHEVLLSVPMEPQNYPESDPGPHTLLVSSSPQQNLEKLHWVLSRFAGYVGVASHMGQRFTTAPEALKPVLTDLKNRGLLILDSRTTAKSAIGGVAGEIGLPRAANDRIIDLYASRDSILARLGEIEQMAKKRGFAVAMGYPFPVTIEILESWSKTLDEKGIVLAPITAIAGTEGE